MKKLKIKRKSLSKIISENSSWHETRNKCTKTLFCIRAKGSFTVEAAMAAPVFLFVLAVFLGLFRVLLVQVSVEQALQYTGGRAAAVSEMQQESAVLFYQYLKKTACSSEMIAGGLTGIGLSTSQSDEEFLDIQVIYRVKLPISYFGVTTIGVKQGVRARKWTGWDPETDGAQQWVYITPTGRAYHSSTSCRYLDLSIQSVSMTGIKNLRNKDGGKYYPCSCCKGQPKSGSVYITDYGTQYHCQIGCSNLKRTVYRIKKSEVGSRSPCKGCF